MRIALGHKSRVGKDTFADYVARKYSLPTFAFSDKLYEVTAAVQGALGVPIRKDPALLQLLGTVLREHYGSYVWIDSLSNRMGSAPAIVTDMRLPNEMQFLKDHGFVTIKITRRNRPIDRDPTHISETALDDAEFDYEISNDGTIDEFHAKIDDLMDTISEIYDICGPDTY